MKHRFDRCIVVQNPRSTHIDQALKRIQPLADLFGPKGMRLFRLEAGDAAGNQQRLRDLAPQLGPKTLLCIAGGDGTVNWVANMLLLDPAFAKVRATPVLPLWGGNANDLAHMLNGAASSANLRRIVESAPVLEVRPLRCRMQHGGEVHDRLACCYISFGASALAAHTMNDPSHATRRRALSTVGRVARELGTVVRVLARAPRFTVEENGGQKQVYERVIFNGSRFAKVERLPLKLTDNAFYHATVERKEVRALLRVASAVTSRRTGDKVRGTHLAFTAKSSLFMQLDGETAAVVPGTSITVDLSPEPLHLLSERLAS